MKLPKASLLSFINSTKCSHACYELSLPGISFLKCRDRARAIIIERGRYDALYFHRRAVEMLPQGGMGSS